MLLPSAGESFGPSSSHASELIRPSLYTPNTESEMPVMETPGAWRTSMCASSLAHARAAREHAKRKLGSVANILLAGLRRLLVTRSIIEISLTRAQTDRTGASLCGKADWHCLAAHLA